MEARLLRAGAAGLACLLLAACATVQTFPKSEARSIYLSAGDLEAQGIAFITPSTATGREEEKQAVAFIFAQVMKRDRPGIRIVSLPEALSAINKADLGEAYKRMYDEHRDTGLFKREMLEQVGRLTGSGYIAQIKLQEFQQDARERFGAFGIRILQTRFARVRLFLQLWDSRTGAIVWEGLEEAVYSHERITEQPVTFQEALHLTAAHLISKLP